jgi:hypothetical protein
MLEQSALKELRNEILVFLSESEVMVDRQVTLVPYRLMRTPDTLHGETGLVAKLAKRLESFSPAKDTFAFNAHE